MNLIHKSFVFFLIFFFILAPRIEFKIIIHMGLVSVAILGMLVAIGKRKIYSLPKPLVVVTTFFMILAIYHLVLATLYDNNGSYFFSICISVIISVVFGWLIASYLINHGANTSDLLDQLLVMCIIVAILNSSIIFLEFSSPKIKSIIESYLLQNTEGLIYEEHQFMLRGIASAGGAGLSVFNAVAILFIIYQCINKKIAASFALSGALFITCSNVFIGRTGLILGLLFTSVLFLIILRRYLKSGFKGLLSAVSIGFGLLFLIHFSMNSILDEAVATWAFEWLNDISSGKIVTASSDDLKTMLFLPDDAIHLFFGIGFFEGIGKIYPRTDSGYLKTILSIGIPMSILLYSAIIFMFIQVNKVSSKYFWLVIFVIAVMMVVEVKEPFFYQNFAARVILLLSGAAMFILAKKRASAKANLRYYLDWKGVI
jgi:hypothetical protein